MSSTDSYVQYMYCILLGKTHCLFKMVCRSGRYTTTHVAHDIIGLIIHTMTNTQKALSFGTVVATVAIVASMMLAPMFAQAADYAYVDVQGEVKMVTASDWMTAIATAMNIHINSGVYMLKSAADFDNIQDAN